MSPRAHQTPPEPVGLVHAGCSYFAFANSVCNKCGQFVIPGPWPNVKSDWPLPSHPEYPPEDEALVVPRDDNQKENPHD